MHCPLTQRLLEVQIDNLRLKVQVQKLQRQKEELALWITVPRKYVDLEVDNQLLQGLSVSWNCIRASQKQWVQVCSKDELPQVGKYTISLITLFLEEQAQIILGVVTEDLRKESYGFWSKQGSVLLNNNSQRALIYQHGTYKDPIIEIPNYSTITMVVDWTERCVSWFLNREVKLGQKPLPKGKVYASFAFYGRSENYVE